MLGSLKLKLQVRVALINPGMAGTRRLTRDEGDKPLVLWEGTW